MELTELGIQPISADKPSGEDVRYDEDFEKLQDEIDKLSIASASGAGINWEQVVKQATAILAEKSKNILVACYLAGGLCETRGFDGLFDGSALLKNLVENFWETLYPAKKRMRGRVNAVEWWSARIEKFLDSADNPAPQTKERIGELTANIKALDAMLREHIEEAPVLNRIIEIAGRWPIDEPKPEPKPAPASAEAAPAQAPAGAAAAVPAAALPAAGAPASSREVEQFIKAGQEHLIKTADYLLQAEPTNALAYRMIRIGAWLNLDKIPMADGGQTMLPAPDSMVRGGIEGLIQAGDFEQAVVSAEGRVREFLFWLDLSRLSADALEKLGGTHQAAYDAVCEQTALFVRRLPGLDRLSFNDGTPFADKETRAWLKSIALGGGGQDDLAVGGDSGLPVAEKLGEAKKLAKKKKLAEAIGLLHEELTAVSAGKDRLAWRLALAQLLLDIGQTTLARPHLQEILNQIDEVKLEEWDPDLALSALLVVHRGLDDEDDDRSRVAAGQTLDRIARIHPAAALKILKG